LNEISQIAKCQPLLELPSAGDKLVPFWSNQQACEKPANQFGGLFDVARADIFALDVQYPL
jgi:hypothetical protein